MKKCKKETSRAGSRAVGTSHGIGNELLTQGSSSGRGLPRDSVGSRTFASRGSLAGLSRSLSDDDTDCHYGCGDDKLCRSGHKCVHDGCSSYCVEISSGSMIGSSRLSDSVRRRNTGSSSVLTRVSSNDGHLSSGSRIGSSGLARNLDLSRNGHLETIGSSRGGRSGLDVLDTVSLRRSGSVSAAGLGVVSQSVVGGKTGCKTDCHLDSDCPTSKYCASVNCHMICRRRRSKGYTP
ncbi:unnamed protein product [Mytilus edulis]|uniref:WAP domain-containing protein n=1 Tax=Mytilus edulis TaxID=6550 RepID=A0A8S3S4Y0_MYTED|nr:unnamed protein product [Mytilus edulis]